jgi:excisionase family DNA binding protein
MNQIDLSSRITITPQEASCLLGISTHLVMRMIREGRLPHKRVFQRYLLPVSGLKEWLL